MTVFLGIHFPDQNRCRSNESSFSISQVIRLAGGNRARSLKSPFPKGVLILKSSVGVQQRIGGRYGGHFRGDGD